MPRLTSKQYFGALTSAAQELTLAEKSGLPIPARFDFGTKEVCAYCQQNIEPPKKPLRCSACKAILYCSKECSKKGWNYGTANAPPNAPTHKQLCKENARHMTRLPDTQAILTQFPWGRLETDGSFNRDVARGRYRVLGGDDMGFWSHKGGPVPHQNSGPFSAVASSMGYQTVMAQMIEAFDHLDGKDLLKSRHLSDEDGWKLPSRLIPYREFASASSADKRPVLVTNLDEPVKDWESWYRWRKLPLESPVALIMDFPMSVYQLVTNCLQITNATRGSPDKRIPISLQMLGVEVELNCLPIFSELALLLPYHDIKIVMVGFSVHKLCVEARKHPKSIAAQASITQPTFSYTAPQECGSGSLQIFLHGESPTWAPDNFPFGRPDALIACNAGLGSYPDWVPVIQAVHMYDIPFGVTEYAEQSAEHQRAAFPTMLGWKRIYPRSDYPIALNPFQSPGQRGIPMYKLPNAINGFTLVVVKHEKLPEPAEHLAARIAELDLD
ncbi:hypothetical protein EUX98_g1354 [Antrodiella citrinella]|uniref:MYND-type domain-containing protein n=1 Tax=Antrodiella citrinella TaxID=2447956 RepID=A0A4S4N4S9_9APHY|nr:hypothetical protein EUX98_g1354 [Antrodiella citrinella]